MPKYGGTENLPSYKNIINHQNKYIWFGLNSMASLRQIKLNSIQEFRNVISPVLAWSPWKGDSQATFIYIYILFII